MKVKDIVRQYGLGSGDSVNMSDFEKFVLRSDQIKYRSGLRGTEIADEDVAMAVELYNDYIKQRAHEQERKAAEKIAAKEAEKKALEKAEIEKNSAFSKMLITSGFNFDGYTIKKYSGYISGDDATTIPRGLAFGGLTSNSHGQNLTDALVKIRRRALYELKEAAFDLGCNAVIGVDFDYIVLEPQTANITGGTTYEDYVICVTANGNAVVIEKNPE